VEDGALSIVNDPNCTMHSYDFSERSALKRMKKEKKKNENEK
jgi:hypothetical protein